MASQQPNEILSYTGNVNIAVHIVRKFYPDARLYEVDGVTGDGKPTTDPTMIDKLRVVFAAQKGTVTISTSYVWGEWEKPIFIADSFVGDRVIPWPIKTEMDITDAQKLKDEAGYKDKYEFVTLRWPLYPGSNEPYYIFSLENQHVFVGCYTKKVFTDDTSAEE